MVPNGDNFDEYMVIDGKIEIIVELKKGEKIAAKIEECIANPEILKTIEKNSEVVSFACTLATEKSTWKRIIRVFRQSRGIEVENIVDWNEKHVLAKAQFDCNVLTRKAVCDTSAGFTERETHRNTTWQQARFECCHHKWCDMSESGGGIALINDGKYGVGFLDNSMSLSLLRATIRPDVTSDMGEHNFCYKILPHEGSFVEADINRKAHIYNAPLIKADIGKIDFNPAFCIFSPPMPTKWTSAGQYFLYISPWLPSTSKPGRVI